MTRCVEVRDPAGNLIAQAFSPLARAPAKTASLTFASQ